MTISYRRLAFRTAFGLICATLLLTASFLGGGKTAARVYTDTPTRDLSTFYCPYEGAFVSFDWGQPMPYDGWLGQAGDYKSVAVQAYDAQMLNGSALNWGFQAQDGSFVCRMYVSSDKNNIQFVNCRPFTNWSLTSCFAVS
jgi:hypothetical protein